MVSGSRRSLARFAWLSIAAAVVTIGLKTAAYRLTGSVGLLSDALESLVNLVAALFTLGMIGLAARPPDEEHAWGYGKAEYFSSGAEGVLILVAAAAIGWTAAQRLAAPRPIESVGLGLAVSVAASLVNLGVSRVLLAAGRRHHSIALEADAHHLMTDVWTSAGVLAGIGAVGVTGWQLLDPLVAIAVAVHILWTGREARPPLGAGAPRSRAGAAGAGGAPHGARPPHLRRGAVPRDPDAPGRRPPVRERCTSSSPASGRSSEATPSASRSSSRSRP